MRVAWVGPTPSEGGGGGPEAAIQMLLALADAGVTIELFLPARLDELPAVIGAHPRIRVHAHPVRWQWDRWYSRQPILAHLSGMLARARGANRIAAEVVRLHRRDPLDVVYQFSQPELLGLRRHRDDLPPIVVHPGVHAMGELRWLWRERALSRRSAESQRRRRFIEMLLALRAVVQRRDIRAAGGVVGISETFADLLARDYGIERGQIPVVHYPIDVDRFTPPDAAVEQDRPIRLLVITAICVRKGIEQVIELSQRLDDLAGRVEIVIAGGHRSWSDYRPLLDGMNARVATYRGSIDRDALVELMRESDGLLQPAPYEPMGLGVAEALACGLPIVASDAVGAADHLHPDCALLYRAGDIDAFARQVRALISRVRGDGALEQRLLARAEAERLFSRAGVGPRLADVLQHFAAQDAAAERGDADCIAARLRSLIGTGAWRIAPAAMADRAHRHQLQLHAVSGRREAARRFVERHGSRVRRGPFAGMRYPAESTMAIPKLLGSYECEIYDWIEEALRRRPTRFVDIGASDGYYAVGFALRGLSVEAFEMARSARAQITQLALTNGVSVNVRKTATAERVRALPLAGALVLSDCEGAENDIFDDATVRALATATVLIEVHESLRPGTERVLRRRFAATHDVEKRGAAERDPTNYPELEALDDSARSEAVTELRSGRTPWLLLTPKEA